MGKASSLSSSDFIAKKQLARESSQSFLTVQLPHYSNSPRLARDALVLEPSAACNRDPTPVTSISNTSQAVPQPSVTQP